MGSFYHPTYTAQVSYDLSRNSEFLMTGMELHKRKPGTTSLHAVTVMKLFRFTLLSTAPIWRAYEIICAFGRYWNRELCFHCGLRSESSSECSQPASWQLSNRFV